MTHQQPPVAATLYPGRTCATTALKPVQALSTNIATARSFVQTLTPGGNTNITIGVQWGMEVLSPTDPFTGGVNFNDPMTHKYMIVVTDGQNTANRDYTSSNPANAVNIDPRTALACTNAKAQGITVFVVKVIEGNSDMLRACASRPDYFYDLSSASQLNTALSAVFEAIKKTRLQHSSRPDALDDHLPEQGVDLAWLSRCAAVQPPGQNRHQGADCELHGHFIGFRFRGALHHLQDPCAPPPEECPLSSTTQSTRPSCRTGRDTDGDDRAHAGTGPG